MLVLSRQRDETIMIGDEIEITVVDIRGDKVRLGIAAPSRIAVHRKEVYESIRRENEQASRFVELTESDMSTLDRPKPMERPSTLLLAPGPGRLRVGVTTISSTHDPEAATEDQTLPATIPRKTKSAKDRPQAKAQPPRPVQSRTTQNSLRKAS